MGTFSKKNIDPVNRNGVNQRTKIIYINQGSGNGKIGEDGQPGITCYLSKTSRIFEGDSDGKAVIGQHDNVEIIAYAGTQRLDTFIDTSIGISGLIEDTLDASIHLNGTKETNVTFSIDSSLYDSSGNIIIPVLINVASTDDTSIGDTNDWYEASESIIPFSLSYQWSVIKTGSSSYRLDLSNEAMAVNCDSSGNVLTGAYMPTCKATLYYGTAECATAYYEISSPVAQSLTGVSIDASGNFIFNDSSLAFQGNSIEITVTAKIGNQTYGIAIATLIKNIPGRNGTDGSVGADAVTYWLSLSCDAVHVNPNTTTLVADPSTMTATVYKQVGAQTPVVDSSCTIKYGYNTSTPTTTYTSAITINANKSFISFGAYLNNVLVDGIETVPILRDGVNGQSAYRLDLTNENAGINADSSGNILAGAERPSCTAKLYLGNTEVSGVTYAISTSATGVSINSSSGVFTFGSNFNFSGTSVEITVTAKIGSTLYGTAIMTVSKNIAGANGVDGSTGRDGSAGADAVTYWLNLSADAVTVDTNNNNSFTPTKIRVKAMKQIGEQTPVAASDASIFYAYDNTPTTSSSSISNDSSISVNITNHDELYVALWVNGVQRDLETIPILRNGTNGTQGTQGTQGMQGYSGIVYRRSVWAEDVSAGKVLRNDSTVQTYDDRYIDLVFNKNNVLLNDPTLKLYKTKVTHTASSSIPLTNTTYFEEIAITSEFYAANIYAGQLSADVIDVGTIKVTDLADINNLVVQNVYSKNGSFSFDSSGNMVASTGTFYGNLRVPLTVIDVGYYGNSSDAYYLSNTTASNFVLSYGYTSSTSEKYVRVILPSPSSSYNGMSYFFLMPPKSGTTTDTSQLAGVKILTSSGTKFYNYSSLGASTQGCSAMIFGPGTCRLLCDGNNWYCIESTSHMRLYYSSAWHDVHEVQSNTISGMELSGTILTIS
jgi:hypothetical protein